MILNNLISSKNLLEKFSNISITDISSDSRKIKAGTLFFALRGKNFDGTKFIDQAIKKGAVAVVCNQDVEINPSIPAIKTNSPEQLLNQVLEKFYDDLPENIFAITGTNGKTSTAEFIRQILEISGRKAASIGTLGVICNIQKIYDEIDNNSLTTPDIVSLYKNLAILKKHGINDVAIEASSIGIEQERMGKIKINVGVFTNFTQDHLDYHQTMDNYFQAKMMLFSKLMAPGLAIINADIEQAEKINSICANAGHKIISYGKNGLVKLNKITPASQAISHANSNLNSNYISQINFTIDAVTKTARFNVLGEFQVMNVLAALAAVYFHHKLPVQILDKIIDEFPNLTPAAGRMQKAASLKNNAAIYIDFAHTPDALKNILENARNSAKARLLVLFGCGGDRDNKKRPIMGGIASDLADLVIISDDNPRSENAAEIRKQILANCNLDKTIEIPGRAEAIKQAILMLEANDILIIAGKGHEKYQIIGAEKFPFDEEKIVKELVLLNQK
jgi:UDP-N-acetylmuramoyl-L-alanyl-D-glutamate--2,6-diaminopimelate ligase